MPSGKNYVRNYQQERETAIRRGETGCGSQSGDATRHRARRKKLKTLLDKQIADGKDVHHIVPIKDGGENNVENLELSEPGPNRSHGGQIGSRSGKRTGCLIGLSTRRKEKT